VKKKQRSFSERERLPKRRYHNRRARFFYNISLNLAENEFGIRRTESFKFSQGTYRSFKLTWSSNRALESGQQRGSQRDRVKTAKKIRSTETSSSANRSRFPIQAIASREQSQLPFTADFFRSQLDLLIEYTKNIAPPHAIARCDAN